MELREKIARECAVLNDRPDDYHYEVADAILDIPELREALQLRAQHDSGARQEGSD